MDAAIADNERGFHGLTDPPIRKIKIKNKTRTRHVLEAEGAVDPALLPRILACPKKRVEKEKKVSTIFFLTLNHTRTPNA